MKIPAAFAPKSWEMPPGFRVLEESASVVTREFDGEKLDWLVALVEVPATDDAIFWARPLDARFDAGFIVHDFICFDKGSDPDHLAKLLPHFWKQNRLGRIMFFNDNGKLLSSDEEQLVSIIVAPDGLAGWRLGVFDGAEHPAAKFEWNEPLSNSDFFRLPAHEIWTRVQKLRSEPSSEASFAYRFTLMNEQERYSALFKKSVGTDAEVKALLFALLLQSDVWDKVPEGDELTLFSQPEILTALWTENDDGFAVPESLKANLMLMWNQCRIVDREFLNHACSRHWYQYNTASKFSASSSRPTMHEQLEAQLRWREWKANHEKL